jgi:hypothetical protein
MPRFSSIPTATRNILIKQGITCQESLYFSFLSGALSPKTVKGYGEKSHLAVEEFLASNSFDLSAKGRLTRSVRSRNEVIVECHSESVEYSNFSTTITKTEIIHKSLALGCGHKVKLSSADFTSDGLVVCVQCMKDRYLKKP